MTTFELTPGDIDAIRDQLEDAGGVDETAIRTGYSGRGMYGGTCLGFVGYDASRFAFELAVVLARNESGLDDAEDPSLDMLRAAYDDIGEPRTDSMATQTVFYWPHIGVAEPDDDDADGDVCPAGVVVHSDGCGCMTCNAQRANA